MPLSTLFTGLAINVVVILFLVFFVYRPRHSKSDLALSYVVLNFGVFAAVALLAGAEGGLALGMGLFGILSIVRLRSSAISQTEVAYYFVALVLGLVNALGAANVPLIIAINALLIGSLAVLDRGERAVKDQRTTEKRRIVLDVVHESPAALRADIEARLRMPVISVTVEEMDYVRATTSVSVEIEKARLMAATAEEAQQDIKTDRMYAGAAR